MACRLGSQTQDCDFWEQPAQSNGSVEETAGLRLHLGSGWNSPPVPEPAFHKDDDDFCSNADFSCNCMTKLFVIRLKALHWFIPLRIVALVLLRAGLLVGRLCLYVEPTQMDIFTSPGWMQPIRTGGRLKDVHKYKLRGQGVWSCCSYSLLLYRAWIFPECQMLVPVYDSFSANFIVMFHFLRKKSETKNYIKKDLTSYQK